MANLLQAEYWPLSSKSGENIELFFRRISVLAFETSLSNEVQENLSRGSSIHIASESRKLNTSINYNYTITRNPNLDKLIFEQRTVCVIPYRTTGTCPIKSRGNAHLAKMLKYIGNIGIHLAISFTNTHSLRFSNFVRLTF